MMIWDGGNYGQGREGQTAREARAGKTASEEKAGGGRQVKEAPWAGRCPCF